MLTRVVVYVQVLDITLQNVYPLLNMLLLRSQPLSVPVDGRQ